MLTLHGKKRYNRVMESADKSQIDNGEGLRLPRRGEWHLGNIFTAMIAYLSSKIAKRQFLLRIEDLDKLRCPSYAAKKS